MLRAAFILQSQVKVDEGQVDLKVWICHNAEYASLVMVVVKCGE